jgi:hypothetical protein
MDLLDWALKMMLISAEVSMPLCKYVWNGQIFKLGLFRLLKDCMQKRYNPIVCIKRLKSAGAHPKNKPI